MAPAAPVSPRTWFRARTLRAPVYRLFSYFRLFLFLISYFSFTAFSIPTKNPAIDWQSRGFLEIAFWLEVPSRDANEAMPHGRLSNDSLVAQAVNKRGVHF